MILVKTGCPKGCMYISGGECMASECPYQTGNVRYDIRMNTNDKVNAEKRFENNMKSVLEIEKKQAVKEFAEKLKEKFNGYEATYYNGHEEGFHDLQEEIDELLKEYEK